MGLAKFCLRSCVNDAVSIVGPHETTIAYEEVMIMIVRLVKEESTDSASGKASEYYCHARYRQKLAHGVAKFSSLDAVHFRAQQTK